MKTYYSKFINYILYNTYKVIYTNITYLMPKTTKKSSKKTKSTTKSTKTASKKTTKTAKPRGRPKGSKNKTTKSSKTTKGSKGSKSKRGGANAKSDANMLMSEYSDYNEDSDLESIDNLENNDIIEDLDDIDEDWNSEEDFDMDADFGSDSDGDGACETMYNNINIKRKLMDIADIDDDDDDEDIDEDNEINEIDNFVPNEERATHEYVTKYEYARITAERSTQLSEGAKPLILNATGLTPRVISQLEFEARVVPLIIVRNMPNGKEKWKLSELKYKRNQIKYGKQAYERSVQSGGGSNDILNIPVVNLEYVNMKAAEIQRGGGIMGVTNVEQYNVNNGNIENTLNSSLIF